MSHFPNDALADAGLSARFDALRAKALLAGAAGLAAGVVGAIVAPEAFFPGYLAAFLFWTSVSLASLGFCLLFQLAGGSWMVPLRRPFEAAGWQILLMAVFFLPVYFGLNWTYAWTQGEIVKGNELIHHKVDVIKYLTPSGFATRAAIYFAIWAAVAYMVNAWSRQQDGEATDAPTRRLIAAAGPATLVMFLTTSFAAFDWGMSRDPEWYSTIYGAMFAVGSLLTGLALATAFAARHLDGEPIRTALTVGRLNDAGNLLLAFTMLWAYFSFSQFLIIWLGNLPEEVIWYQRRIGGIWGVVALGLIFFGFFAPFLALLQRKHKRDVAWVLPIATWIVVMRAVDVAWLVIPGHPLTAGSTGVEAAFPWGAVAFYATSLVGIGGVWTALFLRRLASAPLVPPRDPTVVAAQEYGLAHGDGPAHEPTGGATR
ncbi:hypothetical protein [Paludisphaera sp.]|uniref:hypothetical protein n=1 Tax=Paludisphaera sp. TaxID=2017432 RepID=UPI00301D5534